MARKRKYEDQIIGNVTEGCYGYIYKITNKINGKIYIGQTINTIYKRFVKHILDSKKEDYVISQAIRKYGYENFTVEEIEFADTKEELDEKEVYWISKLNSKDALIGYNTQNGGQKHGGFAHKEKDKVNLRKSAIKKNGFIGAFADKNKYFSKITISGRDYVVHRIKDIITAQEIYDSMAKYYLGDNAVLNFPNRDDIEPLSVNNARKLIKYINFGILYNGVSKGVNGNYRVRVKIDYKEIVNRSFITQIDAAYISDYYIRKFNLDKDDINFENIVINDEDAFEIIKRNKNYNKGGNNVIK